MANFREYVDGICTMTDMVIENPTKSPKAAVALLGLALINNIPTTGAFLAWRYFKNKEQKQQEKEHMLRQVIAKQQAVINKLNDELARSRQQNANNKQEIENLKKMLEMLKDAENKIRKA